MKKLFFGLLLLSLSSVSYSNYSTYDCYRYVNGKPTGSWIRVKADSKEEAESIAYSRMKESGGVVDYAKCKIPLF